MSNEYGLSSNGIILLTPDSWLLTSTKKIPSKVRVKSGRMVICLKA
ncbi:MAG: hypothetical protein F6K14_22060 [Symploca sp. SIO2C1]|nr:hypothetical protein [Symploca sp. SIO2C1]